MKLASTDDILYLTIDVYYAELDGFYTVVRNRDTNQRIERYSIHPLPDEELGLMCLLMV